MRVLQLITQDRGGPVDHAVDVAGELARLGHDSHLAGPRGAYATAVTARGATWHELAVPSKFDALGLRRVDALLTALGPDVVHCQDRRAGLFGRIAARRRGVPSAYTLHGASDSLAHLVTGNAQVVPPRRRDAIAYHGGERWLARMSRSTVVVPCAALGRYAVEHAGLPEDRVRVVPNGVAPRWFRARTDRPGEPVTAVWLGVMEVVKRVPALVRAVADVPDLRLVLVGDGPERPAVQRTVDRCGLAERVRFAGFLDDPRPALTAADLFVLPSAAEACPMALLQAMACGLPVVATAVGGVPEIVRGGVDGVLVPPDDPGELRDALLVMSKEPALRESAGASARRRVADDFSLARTVARLLDIYAEGAT